LIIRNVPEVHQYDNEITITLSDWYHRTAKVNEEWHISTVSRGVPPYPDSGMINGLGRYPCDFAILQNRTCQADLQKRPVFEVQRNKSYRVRVINTSAVAAFNFSIDGHPLETIEVDGVDVAKPVPIDIAPIAAGQRYSFRIRTNGSLERYLIRANLRKESLMLIEGFNINKFPEALMKEVTAVLEYRRSSSESVNRIPHPVPYKTEPFSYMDEIPQRNVTRGSLKYLDESELSPFDGIPAPPYFDQEIMLEVGFYEDHENIRRGSFNRTPFVLPQDEPLLWTIVDGNSPPKSTFPLEVNYMNVIQLVINNPFYGPHPFHLHGHHFWVLGTGAWFDGNYDPATHNVSLTLTGAKRDTVLVQEQSWALIRFVADNPGVWPFHCHIDWHNLSGMSVTFIEAKDMLVQQLKITTEASRVCALGRISAMTSKLHKEPYNNLRNGSCKTLAFLPLVIWGCFYFSFI
jgi:iron transport multicopper oxidase